MDTNHHTPSQEDLARDEHDINEFESRFNYDLLVTFSTGEAAAARWMMKREER